ncbi:MAG TPA: rRNA pseudouridine synthase, partial [Verrucomicrobia bacterium]|nr:rRNA pseudouridine synthase [Verrucomicrobiota bacterium]
MQNVLAQAGISSRRGAAALIASGVVTVDSLVVREAGFRVDPANAKIAVSGKIIAAPERKRTILLYKPVGVLSSTRDPFGGETVLDLIRGQIPERLVPVGRLDKDS